MVAFLPMHTVSAVLPSIGMVEPSTSWWTPPQCSVEFADTADGGGHAGVLATDEVSGGF